MINARSESVAEKPAFREAFKFRRCLIMADGYYEWVKEGKRKVPYYIRMSDERPFAFAGLWERWKGGDDELISSCTVITTESNSLTQDVHDRMPVILDATDYDLWLEPELQDREPLLPLLRPYDSDEMIMSRVSTRVNSVRNDDARCLEVERELF